MQSDCSLNRMKSKTKRTLKLYMFMSERVGTATYTQPKHTLSQSKKYHELNIFRKLLISNNACRCKSITSYRIYLYVLSAKVYHGFCFSFSLYSLFSIQKWTKTMERERERQLWLFVCFRKNPTYWKLKNGWKKRYEQNKRMENKTKK